MSQTDTCSINPNGGPLKIIVKADNGIRSSAKFALWKNPNSWTKVEEFNLVTGESGEAKHDLTVTPNQLSNNRLAWRFVACGMLGQVSNGKFTVEIWQDNQVQYQNIAQKSVPKCQDATGLKFGNNVEFGTNPA